MKNTLTFLLSLFLLTSQFSPCQGGDKYTGLLDDFKKNVRICSGLKLKSEALPMELNPFDFFEKKILYKIESESKIEGVHVTRIFGFGGPKTGFLEIVFSEDGLRIFKEFSQKNSGKIGLLFYKGEMVGVFEISYPLKPNFNICINLNGEFKKFLPLLFSPELLTPILYPIYNSG
jgi:hypothetical protein